MKRVLYIAWFLFLAMYACAQDFDLVIQDIYNVLQEQAETTDGTVDFSLVQSELQERVRHPIYLPQATRTDFESLYFLSAQQIDNILYFIYQHRYALVSLGQLQLVPGLSDYELRDLYPFCTLDSTQGSANQQERGRVPLKQQLLAQVRWTDEKKGNRLGDPLTERVRYRLDAGQWSAGLKMEKDAFEPYYQQGRTWGMDFYGGYVQWTPHKVVDRVVIGDFLVNYGLGLVVHQTPSFYASSLLDQPTSGIKAYTGVDEYRFMRGAGATFRKGEWNWSAFYSAKRVDGLAENGVFQVFSKTGYHRTLTELNRKQQVWEQQAGLHAGWQHRGWQLGLTVVGDFLMDTLRLRSAYYNQNYFSGTYCLTAGLSYRYQHNWYTLFGETAVSSQGGVATLNGTHMQLSYRWALQTAVRYYSRRFDNPLADAYSEFSRMNDERGLLLQVTYTPQKSMEYTLNGDVFDYSSPKYGYRQAGWGWRLRADMQWSVRPEWLFSLTVRWVSRAQQMESGTALVRTRLR